MTAQRGHYERRCDLGCITREEACPYPDCPAPVTAAAPARQPCPEGCPGGHTEAEYYGGGCARRDQEAFEGWGPGR